MLGLPETLLGIEINEHRLLLTELRRKGASYTVLHATQAGIPSEVMAEGKVKQVDTLAELLRELIQSAKIRSTKAHLVVPSQYVVIRQLELPDIPRAKLRKVIDFELQNSIHLPFEDPIYDFVKLENRADAAIEVVVEEGTAQPKGAHCDVMLVASSRSAIDPIVEAVRKAGLKPQSVDIRALAISRAYHKLAPVAEEGSTIMFVDVAENWTDIHICHEQILKFTRNVPMALDSYRIDRERVKPLTVLEILEYFQTNTDYRSFTSDLAYEVERSMNFFRYTLNNRDASLSGLVLTGLLPKSGVLTEYLKERFADIHVQVMPFERLTLGADMEVQREHLYEYAVPIGLSLKEVK